jgi:tetratricopeptide (TPR) repeat protein
VIAPYLLAEAEANRSLPEQAMDDYKKSLALLSNDKLKQFSAASASISMQLHQADIDLLSGDFRDAVPKFTGYLQGGGSSAALNAARMAGAEASEHDISAARAALLDAANYLFGTQPGHAVIVSLKSKMQIDSEVQNWASVPSDADGVVSMLQKYPGLHSYLPTMTVPLAAYAEAKLGKFTDAENHISPTPSSCYDCLIARARIAELESQHGRADYWFARVVNDAPSIPFAYSYWGQALLDRGDLDGAIAKFTLANQKGPKFADPLEGWGEALIAKKQPDAALAKFAEAATYAPNWGRLHLKWGEALGYAGKKDEAPKPFTPAAGLDLSNDDKAELAKVSHG